MIAAPGHAPTDGYYFAPTLLTDVRPDAAHRAARRSSARSRRLWSWDNEDELLDWINDTEYGLAAYVYAGRLQEPCASRESIDAGMVGVNRGLVSDPSAPFGGVKQSGLGREGAREGCASSRRPSTSAWTSNDQAGIVAGPRVP